MKERSEFEKTWMNYAVVLKGNLEQVVQLKKSLSKDLERSGINIVYQKLSPLKLFIKEELNGNGKEG